MAMPAYGTKPGTAFKTVYQGGIYMDEFMAMMKTRMEVEAQYLDQISKLKDSWNPKWRESGVWPLISPILGHFEEEITRRNAFVDGLQARFAHVTQSDTENNPYRSFESLEQAYLACSQADTDVQTPSSQSALQKWYSTFDPRYPRRFPEPDLVYRRAISRQHDLVKECGHLHSTKPEDIMEKHQQHSEDVKSFIGGCLSSIADLVAAISRSCSTATSNIRSFTSASFISPRHDEIEDERSHIYMREYEYRLYHRDGELARPYFGLAAPDTVQLVNQVLDIGVGGLLYRSNALNASAAFELEKRYLNEPIHQIIASMDSESDWQWRMKLLNSLLLFTKPLILIDATQVKQYRGGVPRRKLQGLMESIDFEARSATLQLMVRILVEMTWDKPVTATWEAEHVGWLFTHQGDTWPIIRDIGRKWDPERDCPFPEGVERKTDDNQMTEEIVWSNSGLPYMREA
ncbi:hypothetical protein M408DRAFT_331768 [Serendipita vermifera MAFF 305830]|uniref:Uncharacterized protein n=1 Tax=Serendipita vermifera MAFF 305830 TaxID=933852 RepID=A0A0C3AYL9_SERVB|nr:hypothetical protein M408DRAFT_331768 [Serendipita vermifera MAFF 305830]